MQVSVIIVNYNTQHLTSCCIRSVIEQTKDISYEIIVVDNASTVFDPNVFLEEFPSVILIKSGINTGFASGNNLGIKEAKGEYVLLLNSDTELINDAIGIAVREIQNDSKIGVLSGRLQYPDGRVQPVTGRFPSIVHECYELFRLTKFESNAHKVNRLQADLWDYSVATQTDWVWGTFFLFPKKILQQFPDHQLQQDFFMYYEDVQWCYYIKKKLGLKILYVPEPIILHHLSGSSLQTSLKDAFIKKSLPNQYHFIKKYYGLLYCKTYFFIKGLHLITLRKKENSMLAKKYFSFVFNGSDTYN